MGGVVVRRRMYCSRCGCCWHGLTEPTTNICTHCHAGCGTCCDCEGATRARSEALEALTIPPAPEARPCDPDHE